MTSPQKVQVEHNRRKIVSAKAKVDFLSFCLIGFTYEEGETVAQLNDENMETGVTV